MSQSSTTAPVPPPFQVGRIVPPVWYVRSEEVQIRAASGGVYHQETDCGLGVFLYETPEGGLVERHPRDMIHEPAMDIVMGILKPEAPDPLDRVAVRLRLGVNARYSTDWTEVPDGPKPDMMAALEARADALRGRADKVEDFASRILAVTRSQRWREAVSTALLGDWTAPLEQYGHLHPHALGQLRSEVRAIHRQLVPLWRRRVQRSRVLLLDAPLGDGLCLYDLVADQADFADARLGTALHDDRLVRLVQHLTPEERLVLVALATGDGTTWTEAATLAGANDPVRFGERVRRKTRRLATRAAERRAAARTTSQAAGS